MNRIELFLQRGSLILLVSALLAVNLPAQQLPESPLVRKERIDAERLWEQMIKVRGGREKLHSISNMVLTKGNKADDIQMQFYVYPDKYWGWGKGSIAGHNWIDVTMANLERGWFFSAGRTGLTTEKRGLNAETGATFLESYLAESCAFLLETRWLRPTPVRVSRKTVGKEQFDVIETRFPSLKVLKDWRKDFYVEPESLVVRAVASYSEKGNMYAYYSFDRYKNTNGIETPIRFAASIIETVPKASTFIPLRFDFNIDYDPGLFERIPSEEAGPDAWKPKSRS